MKKVLLPSLLIIMLLVQNDILAQKEPFEMIGKKMSDVIRIYGKPAYHDKSNPAMECVFYQTKDYRLVFVADKNGVYQVEKCLFCNAKNTAAQNFESIMKKCCDKGFRRDSLDVYEYNLVGDNVKVNIKLYENNVTRKYEVRMKAHAREG